MRKLTRWVRHWQNTDGWLVGYLVGRSVKATLGRMSAPTGPAPWVSFLHQLLLPHRHAPASLLRHLFSYRKCGRKRGALGKQDGITQSEDLKKKSEEAEGKSIVKTAFLPIKIHLHVIFRTRYNAALVTLQEGSLFSLTFFLHNFFRRESTSMKLFLRVHRDATACNSVYVPQKMEKSSMWAPIVKTSF